MNLMAASSFIKRLHEWRFVIMIGILSSFTIFSPLIVQSELGEVAYSVSFTFVIFLLCLAVKPEASSMVVALSLAVLTTSLWDLSRLYESPVVDTVEFQLVAISCAAILLMMTLILVLLDVLEDGPVTVNKLCGAACVYLLLGILFSLFYLAAYYVDHGAFATTVKSSDLSNMTSMDLEQSLSYFSFVTLSTVGYGNIVPISKLARTLSCCEAIVGQLYLTILVARLVGLHIASLTVKAANKN